MYTATLLVHWSGLSKSTGSDETAPLTVISRPNREIRDYRSVDDNASRSVGEEVYPDASKDTVSRLR